MKRRKIEIMDTTLRDGEQTSGVSFSISEKLTITQLLIEELNVDRVEIASARVSEGEFQAVKGILTWAEVNGYTDRIEVLTFVDGGVLDGKFRCKSAKPLNQRVIKPSYPST
jgi:D-citramalate synthase